MHNASQVCRGHEMNAKAAWRACQQFTKVPQCAAVIASFLSTTCHLQLASSLHPVHPQTAINKGPLLMLAVLSACRQLALGRLQSTMQHLHSHDPQSMPTSTGVQQQHVPACTAMAASLP